MADTATKRTGRPGPGHGEICEINRESIIRLKTIVSGDGNGNLGLVRKVDKLELSLGFLRKQSWAVIGLLSAILGSMIFEILRH